MRPWQAFNGTRHTVITILLSHVLAAGSRRLTKSRRKGAARDGQARFDKVGGAPYITARFL
jgi:hypothetical protein